MEKKLILFVLILMVLGVGTVFAQQKTGYIKPTFSVGFAAHNWGRSSQTLTALGLDVDFVNSNGLTFGSQTLMAWNGDGLASFVAFGLGYTYDASTWILGAKWMAVPYGDGGMGLDVDGTYWFNQSVGITGILNYYFSVSSIDWSIFSLRVGVSTKI